MTTTAEMQEAEEAAVNVLWMSTRSLERIWGEHRQTGASTYQVANGKFDRFINPLVLKSDFDAMRAQRDEGQHVAEEMSADVSELGAKLAAAEARIAGLREALKHAVEVAEEARKEWDAAPSGMRAGKLLIALGGNCPGYRSDIDAIHAALSQPSSSNSGDTP